MAKRRETVLDIKVNVDEAQKALATLAIELQRNSKLQRQYKKDLDELEKEYKSGNITLQQYRTGIKQTGEAINNVQLRTSEIRKEQRSLRKDIELQTKANKSQEGSLEQLAAQLALNTRAWRGLSQEERENTQNGRDLAQSILETTNKLKEQEGAVGNNRRNVGNYLQAIKQGIGQSLAFGGAIGAIVTGVTSLTTKLISGITTIVKANREVKILTGTTGEAAKEITALGQSISDTYGQDLTQVLNGATALTNELGGNTSDNLESLGFGLSLVGEQGDELLDIIREYPAQFRDSELSASEFIAVATQSIKEGVFSDKGIDAIKEGLLRLREMPQATRDALNAIGISAEDIQKRVESGTTTLFQELQGISAKLDEFPPQSQEVGQAIADIFGSAGEDAGRRYISVLQNVSTNLNGLSQDVNGANIALVNQQKAQERLNRAILEITTPLDNITQGFSILTTNILTLITKAFTPLVKVIGAFTGSSTQLTDAVKEQQSEFNVQISTLGRLTERMKGLEAQQERTASQERELNTLQKQTSEIRNDLNKSYESYLPNLLKEESTIQDIAAAQDFANQKFIEKIRLTAAQELFAEKLREQVEIQKEIFGLEENISRLQLENTNNAAANLAQAYGVNTQSLIEETTNKINKLKQEQAGIADEIDRLQEIGGIEVDVTLNDENLESDSRKSGANAGKGLGEEFEKESKKLIANSIAAIQEEIRKLSEERNNIDIDLNPEKIREIDEQIEALKMRIEGAGGEPTKIPVIIEIAQNAERQALFDRERLISETQDRIEILRKAEEQIFIDSANFRRKGIEDEQITAQRLYENRRERLGLEIALLEEGTLAKIQKKRELAELEAEAEKYRQDKLLEAEQAAEAERQRILEERKARNDQDLENFKTLLTGIEEASGAIVEMFGVQTEEEKKQVAERRKAFQQQSGLVKAAIAVQKAAAAAAITINTVQEISNYWQTYSKLGPIGIAAAVALTAAAVIRSAGALSKIAGFASGGFTGEGSIPDPNAPGEKIAGVVHGGEFVSSRKVTNSPEGAYHVAALHSLHKKMVPGYAGGGFVGATRASGVGVSENITNVNSSFSVDQLINGLSRMPAPVVSVKEINTVSRMVEAKERANSL